MKDIKILIIDDDPDIREILQFNLENEGFTTMLAASAEEAESIMAKQNFDLLLLDVMMGKMSGFQLAHKLRERKNETPIIFLTAKDTENDMLTGFSLGADDFIRKPFSVKEVIARIKTVIKRSKSTEDDETKKHYTYENLLVNFERKIAEVSGKNVILTKKEFEILSLLLRNQNRIFSREDILGRIWVNEFVEERTVDVHIARLRKKLENYGEMIVNRTGYGYTFVEK